ncbi:MAG: PorV/PorQ family protein [Candidatus Latescibacterota bacterium]|nr:PorV/PorQ family protein [Candidatus Latescibacterota bacterium]
MRLLLAALLAWPIAAHAAGLPSLRLSGGARSAALAEAATALPDAQALNPAALQTHGKSAAFSHGAWIQDISQDYLHLTWTRGQGVWGLSGQLWQTDDLERRTGPSAEPLGRFGVYEGAAGLSYARTMDRMRLGLRLKFIRQSISTQNASGGAADLGLVYALNTHLHLGATLRNLGGMGQLDRHETDLPLEIRLGFAYAGRVSKMGAARSDAAPRLLLAFAAQQARGGDLTLHLGGEYRAGERLRLRAGYQNAENRSLSAGLGLITGRWVVDYAYVPFSSGLGNAHRLTLLRESPSP